MVGWSSLSSGVPSGGLARESHLLALVEAGHFVHRWASLTLHHDGHTLELEVSEDALAVGAPGVLLHRPLPLIF
jgi:hypothetical protein